MATETKMLSAVRPVGFVLLVTLSLFAGASWAQQKPGSAPKGESTNQSSACSVFHLAACQSKAEQQCGTTNQNCISNAVNNCIARCQ